MRVAAIQLNSSDEVDRNLEGAERLVRAAAAAGAELVVLPEKWSALAPGEVLKELAEPLDGPIVTACREWAGELGISLVAGSVSERVPGREQLANTSVLIDADGEIAAVYRKIHMFDVDVGGVAYRESEHEQAGDEIVSASAGPIEVGLTVCYDLRFPELFRILALRGATAVTVPSAFTAATGRDHWEILRPGPGDREPAVRDRGQSDRQGRAAVRLVGAFDDRRSLGPGARRRSTRARVTWWPISTSSDLAAIRERLPSLASRRAAAYGWPEEVSAHA